MAKRRKRAAPTASQKRRKAERAAELRLERKRAVEALARKRSRAAKKGWETRRDKTRKVTLGLVIPIIPEVPISAKIRREIARDAIQLAPQEEEKIRALTTKQHLLLLQQGSWSEYRAKAADKKNIGPNGVNPYWYHLVKKTRTTP